MTPSASEPLRVGVMGCAAFGRRAMLPAMAEAAGVVLAAVSSRDPVKAAATAAELGCPKACGYEDLIADPDLEAVYMPLPTGLHEEWVCRCLDAGKHLLVEKSLASTAASAERMLEMARSKRLVVIENFLFLRHAQFAWVQDQLAKSAVGDLKFFRAAFTIPPLDPGNFRYTAALGGGALLDLGAYMTKSTLALLGPDIELLDAVIEEDAGREVDLRGAATFRNVAGVVAQTLWGFDTSYQCTWEFVGTEGRIVCERALTPPPGLEPPVRIERGNDRQPLTLPADNHYVNQWEFFAAAVRNPGSVPGLLDEALDQAAVLDEVRRRGKAPRGAAA